MNSFVRDAISPILRRAVLECLAQVLEDDHVPGSPAQFFRSAEVHALKEEIVRTGKKLWDREYVDGNGGNITARISPRWVICTPTMLSKADLTVDDIALVAASRHRRGGRLVPGGLRRRGPGRAGGAPGLRRGLVAAGSAASGSGCCARSPTWSGRTATNCSGCRRSTIGTSGRNCERRAPQYRQPAARTWRAAAPRSWD